MNRFENGFDSYKKAIKGLENRNENEFALKDVVINFHHSIEVLFKHILYCREKCLIYNDIDKWIESCFNKKIGKNNENSENVDYTITFDETVRRIIVLCEVSIDIDAYDGFRQLSKMRNALIHDEIKLDRDEVEQVFVRLLTVVTHILRNYLLDTDKVVFCNYVDSDEYNEILKRLLQYNTKWKIVTIAKLLSLYKGKSYEELKPAQITHILKTLSALGSYICEEYDALNIDGQYYFSCISYLKQQVCDILMRCNKSELKKSELLKLIRKNVVVKEVMEEYLQNAALYVYQLLGNIEDNLFDDTQAVNGLLNNNLLVNNHDIYAILHCINKITEVCIIITGEKRRKDLLNRVFIDDNRTLSINKIYTTLMEWYNRNGWYNGVNIHEMEDYERHFFDKESDITSSYNKLFDDVDSGIHRNELYQNIIGEMGEWGTIDYIDDITIEDLVTVIKTNDTYTLFFDVTFGTQTYCDHEYYSNGSEECYIVAKGRIVNDEFVIEGLENVGYVVGFSHFRFQ